jgi:hypothetical protein
VLTSGLYLMGQTRDLTIRSGTAGNTAQRDPRQAEHETTTEFPGSTEYSNSRMSSSVYGLGGPPDSSSAPVEEKTLIEWVYGDGEEERRITMTMPYCDDDEVVPKVGVGGWTIVKSSAAEKANRYGRIQNRLTFGYRNGMEMQINPLKMPDHAFAAIYLSIDGLVAQYRVNNPSWVLTAGEVVASCNAIFWGAVGST